MLDFTYVNECYAAGYTAVCGIDEAGRGPLAGNVVAAAVILPHGLFIEGLNDSKKLSEKKEGSAFRGHYERGRHLRCVGDARRNR